MSTKLSIQGPFYIVLIQVGHQDKLSRSQRQTIHKSRRFGTESWNNPFKRRWHYPPNQNL